MQKPFELEVVSVRLVKDAPMFSDQRIEKPEDAVRLLGNLLCEMDREVLCVVNPNQDGRPINCHFVSMGAINQTITEPRELFKASILSNAAQMLIVHNHPSGRLQPSKQDTMVTDRMLILTELLGIRLADHVIVGGDNSKYFSFREKGCLNYPSISMNKDYAALDFEKRTVAAEPGKAR